MAPSAGRIQAFDWLRGLAVLVMIQTHAVALLTPAWRDWVFHSWVVRLDGLVAPSFIFTAGFALALVQVRGARGGRLRAQATRSAKRIGEVLLVASLVNLAWFPVLREPKWLLRVDILHCIGLSLLVALPIFVGLSSRPKAMRWLMLVLALLVFAVSPLLEHVTGFWSIIVNNTPGWLDPTTGTVFALFPWAGYVFLGASVGATAALDEPRQLWGWLFFLFGLGAVLWFLQRPLEAAYPPHTFWNTNIANHGQRWTWVIGAVMGLRVLELRWPRVAQTKVVKFLAVFGTSSLGAYFFHEMLLFYRTLGLFSFTMYWRDSLEPWSFLLALAALEAMTYGCVRAWERLEPKLKARFWSLVGRQPAAA